jgi:hypothetical protein
MSSEWGSGAGKVCLEKNNRVVSSAVLTHGHAGHLSGCCCLRHVF